MNPLKTSIAHLKKNIIEGKYIIQTLEDHLKGTTKLSADFARKFSNEKWGELLGKLHDIGKLSKEFQDYIRNNSGYEENDQLKPKTDHTSAGAIFAQKSFQGYDLPLAYCIAGHHAGLHNWYTEMGVSGDLRSRLQKFEFYEKIEKLIPEALKTNVELNAPCGKTCETEYYHLWVRMLFSCLVDADYLDTEKFMNPSSYNERGKYDNLSQLKQLLDKYIEELSKNAPKNNLNNIRKNIYEQCLSKSHLPSGFFSITVPTGGGKTLATMAWALAHVVKNKMERVIVAIPYTSIITQTAAIYKEIFGEDNVVEHHSNIDENSLTQKSKLAIENWDAPIVVTTNVQLFESLYANKPSKCRKLHNLANSIIILDEVQMLPPEFLDPILSVLTGLVKNFGVSALLSTATQPALTGKLGTGKHSFEGIDPDHVTELIDNPKELSNTLRRVTIKMPPVDMPVTEWGELQQDLEQHDQVLCIVNTRKECKELYDLMPEDTIHLSRMMCTAHIMDTIQEIKQKLRDNVPVRVISTQLIEAGVDIDFPIVYRALTGLDSIAQSAGRCNREDRFEKENSYTRVFCSPKGTPPGLMRKGSDTMHQLLVSDENLDFLSPEAFEKYFQLFYSKIENFDKPQFRDLLVEEAGRMRFQFGTLAKNFRLIDDKGAKTIMVEYKDGANYIEQFKRNGPDRWLMRKIQRYTVALNQYDFEKLLKTGLIEEVHGYYVQSGEQLYNKNTGIVYANDWLEEVHII